MAYSHLTHSFSLRQSKELFNEPLEHRLACPNKDGNGHVRFQANRLEESKGEPFPTPSNSVSLDVH